MGAPSWNTCIQTLTEVPHNGRALFLGYFVPSPLQCNFQCLRCSVSDSAHFLLQDWPNRIVQRIQIRWVWRPDIFPPEVRKKLLTELDCRFGSMRGCPVLLKRKLVFTEMLLCLRMHNPHQNVILVDSGVDFYISFDKDQRCFSGCADAGPEHNRPRKKASFDKLCCKPFLS